MSSPSKSPSGKTSEMKEQANDLYRLGKYLAAKRMYTMALAACPPNDPSAAVILSNRARCSLKCGHLQDALEDAEAAAALDPEWYRPHTRAARALLRMERYGEAVSAAQRAVDLYAAAEESVPDDLVQLLGLAKKKAASYGDSPHREQILKAEAAFFASVERGEVAEIESFVERGGDINAQPHASLDSSRASALIIAVREARLSVADLLLGLGAEVDATDVQGRTALWWAADADAHAAAALLLRAGADANKADNGGVSPYSRAQATLEDRGFSEVLALLDEAAESDGDVPLPDLKAAEEEAAARAAGLDPKTHKPVHTSAWGDSAWFGIVGVSVLATIGVLAYTYFGKNRR